MARTLASSTSKLIGIVVPSIGNAVMPDVLDGVVTVLEEKGYQSIICASNFDPIHEEKLVKSILSWRPQGLILAGLDHTIRVRQLLMSANLRVVELLDTDGEGIDLVVGSSHRLAGRKSAEYLLSRGYSQIGYVGHDISADVRASKRLDGFQSVLQQHGMTFIAAEIGGHPTSTFAEGREGFKRLLSRPRRPDAVYFSSDNLAIGAYFYCLEIGISVPGDVALFGYNGLALSSIVPQPLSTIRSPLHQIGQLGARLLLEGGESRVIDLGFDLIEGATC
jgi:LacI family gluconate utilization system Gnt-I transcriptional repressor